MPDLTPGSPDVVAQAPQSKVGGDAFQRTPANSISPGLEQLSAGLEDLATPLAKAQGEQDAASAVVRNPDGTITLSQHPATPIFGRAGTAYNNAEETALASTMRSSIEVQAAQMATQFRNDPNGFQTEWGRYSDNVAKTNGGEIGLKMQQYAYAIGAQHLIGLIGQKQSSDLAQDQTVVNGRQARLEDQMDGLAAQGLTNSPAFIAAAKEREVIQGQKVSNPAFSYNQDMRDMDDGNFKNRLAVATITGAARDYATKTGNIQAAVQQADTALRALPISEDKRIAYEGEITRHLSALAALNAQQRQALSDSADTLKEQAAAHPDSVTPQQLDDMSMQLERAKMFKKSGEVQEQKINQQVIAPLIVGGTNAQAIDGLHQIQAAAAGGTGGGYLTKLAQQESRGDPNAKSTTSSAQGLYGFTTGTWNYTRLMHPELGLTPDGRTDPAQASKAAAALTTDNRHGLQASGIAPNDGNTNMAHFLGLGGATTFIKAMQADPSQAAANINPTAAAANKSVFYVGGDTTKPRSLSEVYALQTQRFGGASSPTTPVDLSGSQGPYAMRYALAVKSAQAAYNDKTEKLWSGMEDAFGKQMVPTPQEFSDLRAMLPDVTKPELRQKITDRLNEFSTTQAFGQLPVAQQQDAAASLNLAAQQGQLGNVERKTLGFVQTQAAHTANLAKNDPVSLGVLKVPPVVAKQNGLPPITELDPGDADGYAAGLKSRQVWKNVAKQSDPASVSDMPLRLVDREQFAQQAPNWTAQQAATALSSINAVLSDSEKDALLGDKDIKSGIMGMMRSGDPGKMQSAASFLDAQKQRNPILFQAQNEDADRALTKWQSLINLPPEEQAKKMMAFYDPTQVQAREDLKEVAKKNLDGIDAKSVQSKVFGSWTPFMSPGTLATPGAGIGEAGESGQEMLVTYRRAYTYAFQDTGTDDDAKKKAVETVKNLYSPSAFNDGGIMRRAPDRIDGQQNGVYYPVIDGSHDWLKEQLRSAVQQSSSFRELREQNPAAGIAMARGDGITLYSDLKTDADIAAHRPPSYLVMGSVDGRWRVMEGEPGKAMRFRGDAKAAQAQSDQARSARGAYRAGDDLGAVAPMD